MPQGKQAWCCQHVCGFRYADDRLPADRIERMRVLIVEDEPYLAEANRDVPGPSGDEIAKHIVASGSGMPILMLTAADRLDDKASGFELGADDYLTKPFELRELVLRLR